MAISKTAGRKESFLDQDNRPRGIRNNNPGNLILTSINWKGKIPEDANNDFKWQSGEKILEKKFEQFVEFRWGVRAMLKDLINDIKKGKNTIEALIYEYAPPNENRTENYIEFVTNSTGIARNQPIEPGKEVLYPLAKAIAEIETGEPILTRKRFEHGWDLI